MYSNHCLSRVYIVCVRHPCTGELYRGGPLLSHTWHLPQKSYHLDSEHGFIRKGPNTYFCINKSHTTMTLSTDLFVREIFPTLYKPPNTWATYRLSVEMSTRGSTDTWLLVTRAVGNTYFHSGGYHGANSLKTGALMERAPLGVRWYPSGLV